MADGKVVIETEINTKPIEKGLDKTKKEMDKTKNESNGLNRSSKELEASLEKTGKTGSSAGVKIRNLGTAAKTASTKLASLTTTAAKASFKGVVAGVGTATAAIGALVGKSVTAFASYEQLVGGVDTLFKSSSKRLQAYADKAYETAQISANNYMETATSFSASLLQGLNGDTKKAADTANKAIIDMADNANKMGTAMESIQNAYQGFAKGNFTMLDNLKLGYGGTKTEMARLINDTKVLGKTMVTVGKNGNFDKVVTFDKMIEAIHIVQTQLGITGTSAKEASTTIEGSVNSMKAAWSNLVSGMAQDNADIDDLIDKFVKSALTAFDNLSPRIRKALSGVGKLVDEMAPIFAKKLPGLLTGMLPGLIKSASNVVVILLQAFTENLPTLIENITTTLDEMGGTFSKSFDKIGKNLSTIFTQIIQTLIEQIPILIPQVTGKILSLIAEGLENPPEAIQTGEDLITALGTGILQAVEDTATWLEEHIDMLFNSAWRVASKVMDKVSEKFPELFPKLVTGIGNMLTNASKWWDEHHEEVETKFVRLGNAIVDGIVKALPILTEKLGQFIVNMIPTIMTLIPRFMILSRTLVIKLIYGIVMSIPKLLVALKNMILKMIEEIKKYYTKFKEIGLKIIHKIAKGIKENLTKLKDKAKEIFNTIKDTIAEKWDQAKDIGSNLVKGIWEGIQSVKDWIGKKISEFASNITDKVKEIFGIHSPSTVMRDEVGRFLAQGIWVGFDEDNPMDRINKQLSGSLKTTSSILVSSMGRKTSESSSFNYDQLGSVFVDSIEKAGLSVQIGERQFGRIVRSVI